MNTELSWKKFERLVAAIHLAETEGGRVSWNEIINGRQFDVTIRFKFGLHDYLTVIECKDYKDRVSVEKVDAFITKTRDINANKAIMVSSNGYQSGCFETALRHGIKLLTLNEKIEIDINDLAAEFIEALNIYKIKFILNDGSYYLLEEEGGKLQYLVNSIVLNIFSKQMALKKYFNLWKTKLPALNPEVEYEENLMLPAFTSENPGTAY